MGASPLTQERPVATTGATRASTASRAWLFVVALLLVALYGPTLAFLWDRWTMSVWHNAHGLLIPPVVAWAVWQEFKARPDLPWGACAWGFVFLVPALLLHIIDTGLNTQLLSAASIVLAVPGLSLLFVGAERTKAIAFPLAFLAFMLPIPLAFTERLHLVLRHIAAEASAWLLPWFGVPVFKEGTTLHIANATLQVADACSGFSTLYAATAVAVLTAWTTASAVRRALVLVLAAPIAIAANIFRVVLLTLLVYWQGTDVLATSLHTLTGLLTFALSLPVVFWMGQVPKATPVEAERG